MCDRYETCRIDGTDVTPETFWDVFELAGHGDGRELLAGDGLAGDHGERDSIDAYSPTKEQFDMRYRYRGGN